MRTRAQTAPPQIFSEINSSSHRIARIASNQSINPNPNSSQFNQSNSSIIPPESRPVESAVRPHSPDPRLSQKHPAPTLGSAVCHIIILARPKSRQVAVQTDCLDDQLESHCRQKSYGPRPTTRKPRSATHRQRQLGPPTAPRLLKQVSPVEHHLRRSLPMLPIIRPSHNRMPHRNNCTARRHTVVVTH